MDGAVLLLSFYSVHVDNEHLSSLGCEFVHPIVNMNSTFSEYFYFSLFGKIMSLLKKKFN